jgi:hypothetical protein
MAAATSTVGRAPSAATLTTAADVHPLVARAKAFALGELKPAAIETDRTGVTQVRMDEFRELGLLNHGAPEEYGGGGLDAVADPERVILDGVPVDDANVLELVPFEQWQERDRAHASDAGPHTFALAAAVLDELRSEPHPLARAVLATWEPRVAQLRADAYRLAAVAAATTPLAHVDERVAIKVAIGEALSSISRSLVLARSGRAIVGDDTAQLHARNVLFVLVQGQTTHVKDAQLARLASAS